jgi:hypothetical protein
MTVRDEAGAAPWVSIEDVTFQSNVVQRANCGFQLYGTEGQGLHRIKIANNLMVDIGQGWGSNDRTGRWFQTVDVTDLVVDHNTMLRNNSEYLLTELGSGIPEFSFTNTIVEQGAGIAGIVGNAFAANAIIGGSSATYPATNFFPAARADVRFENLSAGNHRLASDSPYKNAATDGKDVGVDWGSFDAAQAGTAGGSAGASSGGAPGSGGSSGAGGVGGSGAVGSGAAPGTGAGGTPEAGVGASGGSGRASGTSEDEGGCGCRTVPAPGRTDKPLAAGIIAWFFGAVGLWCRRKVITGRNVGASAVGSFGRPRLADDVARSMSALSPPRARRGARMPVLRGIVRNGQARRSSGSRPAHGSRRSSRLAHHARR